MYKYVLRPFITFHECESKFHSSGFFAVRKFTKRLSMHKTRNLENEFFGTVSHSNFYNHSTESFQHASKSLLYDQPNDCQLHLETCSDHLVQI